MNTFPLNGTTLGTAVRYATSAGLAGEVDMVFTVSEQNQVPMNGSITMNFTVGGQISSIVSLTASPILMGFTVNGDGLFNNTFLVGTATMGFTVAGDALRNLNQLQGEVVMSFDVAGSLLKTGYFAGEIDMAFAVEGALRAIKFLDGTAYFLIDVVGAMNNNASDVDDDARSFRRPFQQREFRR